MSQHELPSRVKSFEQRGVGFYKTPRGFWFFEKPPSPGDYWCRYADDAELLFLQGNCDDDALVHGIICKMIDRQKTGDVRYKGDIAFQKALQ